MAKHNHGQTVRCEELCVRVRGGPGLDADTASEKLNKLTGAPRNRQEKLEKKT